MNFYQYQISGELLIEALKKVGLDIPADSVLLKICHAPNPAYIFEICFTSNDGKEAPEGADFKTWTGHYQEDEELLNGSRLDFGGITISPLPYILQNGPTKIKRKGSQVWKDINK
jgi:hypothetical protein